jgi:hypothetical protein
MAILIEFEDRPHLHEDRGFALDGKIGNPAFQIDRFVRPFPSRADRTARRSGKHRSPCGTYETTPSIPRSGDNPSRVRGVYYFLDDATSVWAHCTSVNSPLVAISAPRSARWAVTGAGCAVRGQGCGVGGRGWRSADAALCSIVSMEGVCVDSPPPPPYYHLRRQVLKNMGFLHAEWASLAVAGFPVGDSYGCWAFCMLPQQQQHFRCICRG